jgi:chitodextrinase
MDRGQLLLLAALLALLALAPALAHAQAPADSVGLVWTAPGDDGNFGTASAYELRMMTAQPINDANWTQASVVPGLPAPAAAGTRQRVTVRNLVRGTTYWFAIKTVDDSGNWSGISNVVRWDWVVDTAPPSSPSGLGAALEGTDEVRVHWSANSEPDLAGYSVYRATDQAGPFARLTGAPITSTQFLDSSIPVGATAVWYRVTASDVSGNESAQSSAINVSLVEAAANWRLDPSYPNPSGVGTLVHLPMLVPGGAGGAVVEITNSAGQRVWRRDLGNVGAGPFTLDWDGRNDAGRDVAPGVYTAWLVTGDLRLSVKLVRVP